jgi:predicted ATPase
MKHVKLFEQFVNEKFNSKRAAKELIAMGFKNVDDNGGEISVETAEMENPFGHDAAFTFFWNGKGVWAEAEDGSYVEQAQEIETVEQFADCLEFGEGWS